MFWPYLRDPETLARPWAVPGTPGLMHRVGGLEKEDGSGDISYTPDNHGRMVDLRAAKIKGIAKDIPPVEVHGDEDADLLVLGWGSTWGTIDAAVGRARHAARRSHTRTWCTSTRSRQTSETSCDATAEWSSRRCNSGHLWRMVRAEFLVDARGVNKVQGTPFTAGELETAILEALND